MVVHEHRCTLSRHCFFPTTRRRNKIMSQSNQLSCQTKFVELLHGKIDTVTLAEFQQLQVQMDSSNDRVALELDATSNVGLKKVFNEASKTGTIKDIDAICKVMYNILGEHSNGMCPFVWCRIGECTNHLLFQFYCDFLPIQWPTLVAKDKWKQTLKT